MSSVRAGAHRGHLSVVGLTPQARSARRGEKGEKREERGETKGGASPLPTLAWVQTRGRGGAVISSSSHHLPYLQYPTRKIQDCPSSQCLQST